MTSHPHTYPSIGTPPASLPSAPAPTGPAGAVTDPAATDGGGMSDQERASWLALSVAMTDETAPIAEREDLLVSIAPGSGRGAPACFLPTLARIEIDAAHFEVDPATAAPHRGSSDRTRYGVAWGLLTHECAHARHSVWAAAPDAPPGAVAAATLLEEARIEAAQVRRRPDDRHWLRASSTRLILDTTAPGPAPGPAPAPAPAVSVATAPAPTDATAGADTASAPAPTAPLVTPPAGRADAAHSAALMLARVDAGIFTAEEVAPVARVVEVTLGAESLGRLRVIWRAALTVADDDAEAMIELGRRWCEEVGLDPAEPGRGSHAHRHPDPSGVGSPSAPAPGAAPAGPCGGTASDGETPATDPAGSPGVLADAMAEACTAVEVMVLLDAPSTDQDPATDAATQRAERNSRERAEATADKLITTGKVTVGGGRYGRTATAGTRAPDPSERSAARVLGRALDTAGVRERVATRTGSVLPPGRLRMRGARAADAQRAAGAMPTAEPFVRTTRRTVPAPPLRIGVACDVSGSMYAYAGPVASTAWILAHAAHHARVPVTTATVIFGRHVRIITRPGEVPSAVTEFATDDDREAADVAIDALDGALDLSRPGAARLLVIVSDGLWRAGPRRGARARVERLLASGCGVLWLAPVGGMTPNPLPGVIVHPLTDPAATARAVGRAATTALRAH